MASLQTLNRVTDYLGTVPQRRKTIFYVSPGVPVDMQEASSVVLIGPGTSMADHDLALDLVDALRDMERAQSRYAYGMRDALVRAQHGNVNIYSIDPGGLGGLQFFLQNRTSAGAPVEPPVASMQKASLHREYLRTVANNSGGRAIVDTNDLAGAVAGIFRENSSYYLLGYRSTRGPDDRKVRQVDVQVEPAGRDRPDPECLLRPACASSGHRARSVPALDERPLRHPPESGARAACERGPVCGAWPQDRGSRGRARRAAAVHPATSARA